MDRTRRPAGDRYPGVLFAASPSPFLRYGLTIRMAILWVLFIFCSAALAQMPTDGVQGVYAAQVRKGQAALYGILQQLPSPPPGAPVPRSWRTGVLLRAMITAGPSIRRQPGHVPCRQCTAQHFFLWPSRLPTGGLQRLRAMRHPPRRVTYLDVKGREYFLSHIRVRRTKEGFRLTGARLMRTGFVPPILKKRLRLRFDAPVRAGGRRDGIVATALAETGESMPGAR